LGHPKHQRSGPGGGFGDACGKAAVRVSQSAYIFVDNATPPVLSWNHHSQKEDDMTELVIEKSILPELISSRISTEKVLMREENQVITLRPVTGASKKIDPDIEKRRAALNRLVGIIKGGDLDLDKAKAERLFRQ
jgi:hypothetical protein